jgi:hypothetical protein
MILYSPALGAFPVDVLVVSSGEKIRFLQDPKRSLLSPEFSPDDRWICWHRSEGPLARRVFVVPFRRPALGENEWIPITDGSGLDREPYWSPDGNLLYFLSEREGFRCVWAQRLDPATKRPVGAAFPVYHSHRARLSLMSLPNTNWAGLSVARDKLVFSMGERTGNIWMTKLEGQH